MSTSANAGARLLACLGEIQSLLEKGEVGKAAAMVPELNAVVDCAPEPMDATELARAQQVLSRCGEMEQSLRRAALEALQRLGATRRGQVYRQP